MFIAVILFYLLIIILEIVPIVKKGQKKELIVYSLLISVALIISLLLSLGVKIPSPAEPIKKIIQSIMGS